MSVRNILYAAVLLVFTAGAGCRVSKQSVTKAGTPSYSLDTRGPVWGAVWQQRAAEYKALCFQAYNTARLQLDRLLTQPHDKPLAVVTDIDETVLDNSPYTLHRALLDSGYSEAAWLAWTARSACDTVPGALSFLQYAAARKVQVFYISNRLEAERTATLQNLQRWNFPDADNDHLLLKQTTSGKEERRQTVAKQYDILLLMGDNLSDFSSIFDKQTTSTRGQLVTDNAAVFGNRFIVLPNVMYGDWEGALFDYRYGLQPAQKDSIIEAQLKTY
jgi:5'-nucleotidase (lipoprotein e(P4) family)